MAGIFPPRIWTQQPQQVVDVVADVHSALTPVGAPSGNFRIVKGSGWYPVNAGALSTKTSKSGIVVTNASNGYYQRDNPFQSGPLTVIFSHTPSTVSGVVGLWSIGFSAQIGAPNLIIQRDTTSLKFYVAGAFRLTLPNAFAVGQEARIALSIEHVEGGFSQAGFLAINGVVYALSSWTSIDTNLKPYEFLGSGYNGQGAGDYGEYFAIQRQCSPAELISFTNNPYQLFRPVYKPPLTSLAPSGAYTLTAQAGTYTAAGQNAQLRKSKLLTTSGGSYNLSGSTANILRNRKLTSSGGAYLAAGSDASLYRFRQLSLTGGSYSISGASASITFTGLSANFTLTAQGGIYSLSGSAAGITYTPLSAAYMLIAQGGSYTISGGSADLKRSKKLIASGGLYTYSGSIINITAGPAVVSTLVKYINVLTGEILLLQPF